MPRKKIPKFFQERPLCQGKRRYPTEAEAMQVADEQELIHYHDDLELKVYRCITCGDWHLTRQQKSVY